MKNVVRTFVWITVLSGLLVASWISCGKRTNPGVEAGNPNLEGSTLLLSPTTGNEEYSISFVDDETAEVSQFARDNEGGTLHLGHRPGKKAAAALETVTVPFQLAANQLSLSASFANGRQISVAAVISDALEISAVTLTVDGVEVALDSDWSPGEGADDSDDDSDDDSADESDSESGGSSLILSDFSHLVAGASDVRISSPILPRP